MRQSSSYISSPVADYIIMQKELKISTELKCPIISLDKNLKYSNNDVRHTCDSHQALSVRPSLNTSSCKGNLNPKELNWPIISLDKNLKYPNDYVRYKCDSHQAISVRPPLNHIIMQRKFEPNRTKMAFHLPRKNFKCPNNYVRL